MFCSLVDSPTPKILSLTEKILRKAIDELMKKWMDGWRNEENKEV